MIDVRDQTSCAVSGNEVEGLTLKLGGWRASVDGGRSQIEGDCLEQ